ncbi:hypothetical protein [Burkholderia lata]|uniref:hypothetical protein n=1 Tax=Burkholderia lata (strain ATCC 17760 / DSM 23089 / LMG 22485 / NCIMB 9086 / R18194 / 383) TaxID=482957 RepID=UPI0015822118|nr:hypothetical protein [Burkholderia lata]
MKRDEPAAIVAHDRPVATDYAPIPPCRDLARIQLEQAAADFVIRVSRRRRRTVRSSARIVLNGRGRLLAGSVETGAAVPGRLLFMFFPGCAANRDARVPRARPCAYFGRSIIRPVRTAVHTSSSRWFSAT